MKMRHGRALGFSLFLMLIATAGCSHFGHYPLNAPLDRYEPGYGYLARNMGPEGNSEELLLILSFSGGGTRAAAFSYGVLEELRATEVAFDGRKRRLVDEVDMISGVSGGSFTAAYYGLFGERIFEDYEGRFLKKNVQGDLKSGMFLNPVNWFRLSSPFFDRSDLAAEYYDKNVFDGKTFGDMLRRKGPMVLINATDMSLGVRITFNQNLFNAICSDLSKFPVARACAASSAVPGVLTPITLKNYAGRCGFVLPPEFETLSPSYRMREMRESVMLMMDSDKKHSFHLIDGGVADNLGLRAIEEAIDAVGNAWTSLKLMGREKVRKVVFIVVNAETKIRIQVGPDGYHPSLCGHALELFLHRHRPLQPRDHGSSPGKLRTVDRSGTDGQVPPGAGLQGAGILRRYRVLYGGCPVRIVGRSIREGLAVRIADLFSAAPRGRGQAEGRGPQSPGRVRRLPEISQGSGRRGPDAVRGQGRG